MEVSQKMGKNRDNALYNGKWRKVVAVKRQFFLFGGAMLFSLLGLTMCQGGRGLQIGGNQLPIPAINAFPTSGQTPLQVHFISTGSKDLDGRIVRYEWDFEYDGKTFDVMSIGPEADYTYYFPGIFTAALRIWDDLGGVAVDTVNIEVSAGTNQPPRVDGKVSSDGVNFADSISTFRGANLYFRVTAEDPEGGPLTLLWNFGDGTTSHSPSPRKSYTAPGTYLVTVTAIDNAGLQGKDTVVVHVAGEWNFSPSADALVSLDSVNYQDGPIEVPVNTLLYFLGKGTDPEDGNNVNFRWDFGDGSFSSEPNPIHTFTQAGDFIVILRVTDTQNNAGADTISIKVFDPRSPTVRILSSIDAVNYTQTSLVVVPEPGTVYFRAEGSDPLGMPLTYTWDFGDGTPQVVGQSVSHSFATQVQPYLVRVIASNPLGRTGQDTTRVQVNQKPVAKITPLSPTDAEITYDEAGNPIPVSVDFTGAESFDPDGGSIISYEWDFQYFAPNFDVEATGVTVSHSFDQPGGYIVALRVRDNFGLEDLDTILVTMRGNARPKAVIVTTPTPPSCPTAPCLIIFDGSQSTDDSGIIDKYQWIFNFPFEVGDTQDILNQKFEAYIRQNGNPDSSLVRTSFTYLSTGRFFAALRVFDPEGAFHIAVVSISVAVAVGPPFIESVTPQEVVMTQADLESRSVTVNFSIVACNPEDVPDFDGTSCKGRNGIGIIEYLWDFGDGSQPLRGRNLSSVQHLYTWSRQLDINDPNWMAGYFNVTVRVRDREGEVSCWGAGIPGCVRPLFRVFVSPFLPERDILSQSPVIDPAPPFLIEDAQGRPFNFCVDPGRTQCFSGATPPNRLDHAIVLHWCFLSSDGTVTGTPSQWCNEDRAVLQDVWSNRDRLPDNDKFEQYYISLDQFSPAELQQWLDNWGALFPIGFPILRDIDRNPPEGLDAWETYVPFSMPPGSPPPPVDRNSPDSRLTVLINRNGNVRFAVRRDIAVVCPAFICGTPRDITFFDLVTHFLKIFRP